MAFKLQYLIPMRWRIYFFSSFFSILSFFPLHAQDKLVILTHPCRAFDIYEVAKEGTEGLEQYAQNNDLPVVILENEFCKTYTTHTTSALRYTSSDGQLKFPFTAQTIYVAGGYFEWCLDNTINDILAQFLNISSIHELPLTFTLNVVADATYQLAFPPENPRLPFGTLLSNTLDRWYEDEDRLRYWTTGWIQLRPFYNDSPMFDIFVDIYGKPSFYRKATQSPSHMLNIHFIDTSDLK